MGAPTDPKTLQDAILFFADPVNCREYLMVRRWPKGVECPKCGSKNVLFLEKYNRWHCREKHPAPQFTLKTGTVMEDSPIGLDKWLLAMWMLGNCKNGMSSYELSRAIGITQKSAWFMLGRIRLGMQDEATGGKIGGGGREVEVDETYIGGKVRNMHKDRKARVQSEGRNKGGKTTVIGMLERGGTVRAVVTEDRKRGTIQPLVREHVERGSDIFADEFSWFWRMDEEYRHNVINHLEQYVDGNVHTNGIENFWSLLKRTIGGTYVSVEPYHLFRYVDEQAFRFNNRKPMDDGDRFSYLVRKIVGKRLTYAELTGKEGETAEAF